MKNSVENDSLFEMLSGKNPHRDGSREKHNTCSRHEE